MRCSKQQRPPRGEGHAHEVEYLFRFILWNNGVFTIEGDTKHTNILMKEWEWNTAFVDSFLTRDGMDKVNCGEPLGKRGERSEMGDCEDQLHGLGQRRSIKCGQCCFAMHE